MGTVDEFKLIGLEKISLRFHLLRRLALKDNPIQSTAARELLLNKYARIAGGWYELILIIIMPSIGLVVILLLPGQYLGLFTIWGVAYINVNSIVNLIGALIGIFLLALPIVRVIKRDFDSNGLKYTILNCKGILSGLLQVQIVSYLIPQVIGSLIGWLISAYFFYEMTRMPDSFFYFYGFEIFWPVSPIQAGESIGTAVMMIVLSIIFVLKIRNLWVSFAWLFVTYFLIAILSTLILSIGNPIGSVAIFMILWAALTFRAYTSILKAVMPE